MNDFAREVEQRRADIHKAIEKAEGPKRKLPVTGLVAIAIALVLTGAMISYVSRKVSVPRSIEGPHMTRFEIGCATRSQLIALRDALAHGEKVGQTGLMGPDGCMFFTTGQLVRVIEVSRADSLVKVQMLGLDPEGHLVVSLDGEYWVPIKAVTYR